MSNNVLKLIPSDPTFIPPSTALARARKTFASFVPKADEIQALVRDEVEFIDSGANMESISCPKCSGSLEIEWWQEAMSKASDKSFKELGVTLPCCRAPSSLNDLNYDWPAGFARFSLEARNPGVKKLKSEQIRALKRDLGSSLRVIWAHY